MSAHQKASISDLVLDAESDMKKVQDLALILNHFMEANVPIDDETQRALSWITCDLVSIGRRLCDRFDKMDAALHEGTA